MMKIKGFVRLQVGYQEMPVQLDHLDLHKREITYQIGCTAKTVLSVTCLYLALMQLNVYQVEKVQDQSGCYNMLNSYMIDTIG